VLVGFDGDINNCEGVYIGVDEVSQFPEFVTGCGVLPVCDPVIEDSVDVCDCTGEGFGWHEYVGSCVTQMILVDHFNVGSGIYGGGTKIIIALDDTHIFVCLKGRKCLLLVRKGVRTVMAFAEKLLDGWGKWWIAVFDDGWYLPWRGDPLRFSVEVRIVGLI
jgi:hypothetical protein